ncbi:methyl-accepting chemotaxis protein [Pseudophaeobacter sp. EL27]|uniref:methyl-accepting chemotaxis protein n=1 Tax=Pseudophaeobacter sp. EL27 TaxID=2107580 RepID=UPI0020B15315|nr:methyl-accepting chemotaxis protein [Pseudophaeobacter sp. EL27]
MLRNISINARLLISGFAAVSSILFLAALATYSLWQSELELERQISVTEAVRQELTADIKHKSMEGLVIYSLLAGETLPAGQQTALSLQLAEEADVFLRSLREFHAMPSTPEITALIEAALPSSESYVNSSLSLQKLAFSDNAQARQMLPSFMKEFVDLEYLLKPLGANLEAFAHDTAIAAREHDMNMLYTLLAVSVLTVSIMLYNARKTTLTITRPIERLRSALKEVAKGDFGIRIASRMRADGFGEIAHDIDLISERVVETLATQEKRRAEGERVITRLGSGLQNLSKGNFSDRISEVFDDEYDPLRVDYNETVDNLNELISKVVLASQGIQGKSSEIRVASEDLSTRTASQAATLEETVAAMEQMAISVNTAAENTKEVEQAVVTARSDVEHSGRVVEGAIAAMNEIEASSSRISQIIGVIDDIAFQTNLLALNAGVEAARAGEVGRGFAVVASEVRGLAQRSSEAAKEIKILIGTSSAHVQDGVQQVDGAGKALEAVVLQVAQISELVSGISAVSANQATGINEVNIGMSQLDEVTQKNATMVEDSSSAILSLNNETSGLTQLVGQFVLHKDSTLATGDGQWQGRVSEPPIAEVAENFETGVIDYEEEVLSRSA